MKIAINAILFHTKPRGVGNYFNTLISELNKLDDSNEYYVFYAPWMNEYEFTKIKSDKIKLICLKIPRGKILRNLYLLFRFPFKIKKYKPDLLHNIDSTPVIFKTTKVVSTIHDLAEFIQPEKYGKIQGFARRKYVRIEAKKSDAIITVSNYSKATMNDILKINNDKIFVVYNSFNKRFETSQNKKNVFLTVGEIERSKNFGTIIKAFDKLDNKDYKLVIVGKQGNDYENVNSIYQNSKNKGNIEIKGYVSSEELTHLYQTSKSFVFASKFEGFGIPIIEAQAYSLPVICSNSSCLPEVAGDGAIYFDPENVDELEKNMRLIIDNEELCNQLIKKGNENLNRFLPSISALQTVEVYKSVCKK